MCTCGPDARGCLWMTSVVFVLYFILYRRFGTFHLTIAFCFELGVPHLYSFSNKMMFFSICLLKTHTQTRFELIDKRLGFINTRVPIWLNRGITLLPLNRLEIWVQLHELSA